MRDSDLWFPYDNEPEPEKYTVLVGAKIWSYVDLEAYGEEDLKEQIKDLPNKKILDNINELEIEEAQHENFDEIFNDSWEERYRQLLTIFLRKFVEEGNKEGQTLEEAYSKLFEFYKEKHYDKYI